MLSRKTTGRSLRKSFFQFDYPRYLIDLSRRHESAHLFGAVHDCDANVCSSGGQCCQLSSSTCDADGQYLMNPFSTTSQTEFSPCTIGNICSMIGSGDVETSCLMDNDNVPTITAGECGNGIVEEGEDCDCGEDDETCSDCCDGSTCRFREGAVCDDAAGPCCTDCQFASADTVCRASTGSCDIEETCTGNSSPCPEDRHVPNGQTCGDDSSLFCASGQCTNRDMQCREQMDRNSSSISSCDSNSCSLRCSGTGYGSGDYCMSMDQFVLDGTPCSGGLCDNGQCQRDESSWVDEHRSLVIGLSAGIGGALVLAVLFGIICCCCSRKKGAKKMSTPVAPVAPVPPPPYYAPEHGFGTAPRYY